MKKLKLTDLIEVELLQRVSDEFSNYTGMACLITDAEGNPITEESGFTDFCTKFTRKSKLGCARCIQSDKDGALAAFELGKPAVYHCHTGLIDYSAPILVDNEIIGCVMGGQVRDSETDEVKIRAVAQELGIEFTEYYEAFLRTKCSSKKELQRSAAFLGILASVLSEMAYHNYIAIDKYRTLERAARSQSHFLMDLSTDLHKNMSEWIATLEEVIEHRNVESVMDVIDKMLFKGTATYSIIGDIVDYMKFSDGNVELYETTYRIRDLIQAVVEIEGEGAKAKGVTLSYRVAEDVPELLFGDAGRLSQMLTKLISNELAVLDGGSVTLGVAAKKVSYAYWLCITLQDAGDGMKKEDINWLREYFTRGSVSMKNREESGEFELSSVDLFVRQMHGKISVDSEEGKGTVFTVELPQLKVT